MSRLSRLAGAAAALAGIGAVGVAGLTAWTLNARPRPALPYTFTPFEVQVPAQDLRLTAADGVPVAGWLLPRPEATSVVICCHGHRGSKADMLGLGPGLWRAGHEVVLLDFRGCGESGDGPASLALYEQQDLRVVVDWVATHRPGRRISVVAFSMGAATAILAAADDPRVERLVLDSPFARMDDLVAANLRRRRLPAGPVLALADLVNRVGYGYRYAQVRPVEVVARLAPRPVLLLHATEDSVVPYRHALELLAASGDGTELVTFEGLDHCGGYFADRPGYIARVAAFLASG